MTVRWGDDSFVPPPASGHALTAIQPGLLDSTDITCECGKTWTLPASCRRAGRT